MLEIVADAVDPEIGSYSTGNAFERRNVSGKLFDINRISFDVSIESQISRLKFRVAGYRAAEGICGEIRQIDGVIEVLEMRGDIGGVKPVVCDRRHFDVGFDQGTVGRARQLRGEGGNAVDGYRRQHRTRLKTIGRGVNVKVRSFSVNADRPADVGKLIVGGKRRVEQNFFVIEVDGAVDVVNNGLLDENSAVGDSGSAVDFQIVALPSYADVGAAQNAVENLNALGDFAFGNERQIIANVGAVGGNIKSLARTENGGVDDEICIERGALDVCLDIVDGVDLDVGIDVLELDRIVVVRSVERFGASLQKNIFGAVEF